MSARCGKTGRVIYQNEPDAQLIALKGWRTGNRRAVSLRVMRCPYSSSTHYHLVPDGEDLIPEETTSS